MITDALRRLIAGQDLTADEAEAAMTAIMDGAVPPVAMAGFLVALAAKGETPAEVVGCARAMRAHAVRVEARRRPIVDTCGTGGDGSGSFNISTAAALVVAGAGVPVAKHGNRGVTSRSGSAEVLAALGVNVDVGPEQAARALEEIGFAFLFAPRYHPSMAHAAPVRRELGVPTVFNLLGPLTNPAGAERQLIGVARAEARELLAAALAELGTEAALVVHGHGGVDEITLAGPTEALFVERGGIRRQRIDPQALGLPFAPVSALAGGDPEENAAIVAGVLQGREDGPRRAVVLLNAAAALWVAGVAEDLVEGLAIAERSIDSGAAWSKVEALRRLSDGEGS